MKALVLAAGYATRLYPLTLDRPKALLQVGGRPMLDHVLERLQEMGVKEPGTFPHRNDLLEALIGSGSTEQEECLRAEMSSLGR